MTRPRHSYEDRHYLIAAGAWDRSEFPWQVCADATTNAYHRGISDADWLAATLKRLGQRQ